MAPRPVGTDRSLIRFVRNRRLQPFAFPLRSNLRVVRTALRVRLDRARVGDARCRTPGVGELKLALGPIQSESKGIDYKAVKN